MKYTNRIIDPRFARLNGVLLYGPIMIPAATRIWLFTDYIEAESWIMNEQDRIDSGTAIVGISSQAKTSVEWEMYTRGITPVGIGPRIYKCLYFMHRPVSSRTSPDVCAWGTTLTL